MVGDESDKWEAHVKQWIGLGWKKTNIAGMLETFEKGIQQKSNSSGNFMQQQPKQQQATPAVAQQITVSKEW